MKFEHICCSKTHSQRCCSNKLVPRYVVTVMETTSMVDLLMGFVYSRSFHLRFSQTMFYTPTYTCCVVFFSNFFITSSRTFSPPSRHHDVITCSKISFHVHASNVDHAITCGKGSFHVITSNISANHASRQKEYVKNLSDVYRKQNDQKNGLL